jgi:hypothetical protein
MERMLVITLAAALAVTACSRVPEGYAANDLGVLCKEHPEHPESPELQFLPTHGTEEELRGWYRQQKGYVLVDTSWGFAVPHPEYPDYYILTWERERGFVTACVDVEL